VYSGLQFILVLKALDRLDLMAFQITTFSKTKNQTQTKQKCYEETDRRKNRDRHLKKFKGKKILSTEERRGWGGNKGE
jgi:hypothetical protein